MSNITILNITILIVLVLLNNTGVEKLWVVVGESRHGSGNSLKL